MNKLLWIDMEMTGLDIQKEVVIEVAAVVTDIQLKPLSEYHAVVKQDATYLANMDAWNTSHHTESGLVAQVPQGKDPEQVEKDLIRLIDRFYPGERPVLAGNSIAQDRLFIDKYFKTFASRLHYRVLDVTSWKILFNAKYNLKHEKKNSHRAVDDIKESIAELEFYLSFIQIPPTQNKAP